MEYFFVENEQCCDAKIIKFLLDNSLNYQQGIQSGIIFKQDNKIISSGFIADHLLCDVAIDASYRHQGLLSQLMTLLLQQAIKLNKDPVYLMTKKNNEKSFNHCGLYTIINDDICLMSNDKYFLNKENINNLLEDKWIWPNYFCDSEKQYKEYKLKMKNKLMEVKNGNC